MKKLWKILDWVAFSVIAGVALFLAIALAWSFLKTDADGKYAMGAIAIIIASILWIIIRIDKP